MTFVIYKTIHLCVILFDLTDFINLLSLKLKMLKLVHN